jgi:hypothetical protein
VEHFAAPRLPRSLHHGRALIAPQVHDLAEPTVCVEAQGLLAVAFEVQVRNQLHGASFSFRVRDLITSSARSAPSPGLEASARAHSDSGRIWHAALRARPVTTC